jgi:hypothetical protein
VADNRAETQCAGALFLTPIVLFAYLLNKVFDFARGLKPVAKVIPDQLISGTTWKRSWRPFSLCSSVSSLNGAKDDVRA